MKMNMLDFLKNGKKKIKPVPKLAVVVANLAPEEGKPKKKGKDEDE